MASTTHSVPGLRGLLTGDVDMFTPDSQACFLDEVIASVGEGGEFATHHGYYVEHLRS